LKLRLVYSHDKVGIPVLSNVVHSTGVLVNILEAKVTAETGEVVVDVPADEEQLEEALSLFKAAGVSVEKISTAVTIDYDRCIACGSCVSPCPVDAIRQNADWTVELDEAKCVRCLICVNACPVRAIGSS
jgi:ferredoxin